MNQKRMFKHNKFHKSNDHFTTLYLYRFNRLFDGQYSAYSSHVQPVREQHSEVMEPPDDDLRLPFRRNLSIV